MRRLPPLLVLAALAVLSALLGRGPANSPAAQDEAPPPTPLADASVPTKLQYQGVASCAAVACHHGNGPRGTKGSEYTTWIAQHDPHARAYTVLFDRQSLLIQKNLDKLLEEDQRGQPPHQNSLCLNCHVHPDYKNAVHAERFSQTDGVGCESCHGPAEKWLSVHYLRGKSRDELYNLGMTNTKNVSVRAQVCVRCHVGWEESDVNHDLIAAGHPRLRFEYGAYLANYPARHWKLQDDHARYEDFEARTWLVGQVAAAKAAVDLLRYRADQEQNKPWPEFAEYGCFGCHHDLQDQKWRRKPGAGRLPWGTWYFSQREIVARQLSTQAADDLATFARLETAMARSFPRRDEVLREAARASRILERWLTPLGNPQGRDKKSLEKLLATLVKEDRQASEADWDHAVQRYLGIAAIYHALDDRDASYHNDTQTKDAIRRLAQTLSQDIPRPNGIRYDSPRNFQPDQLRKGLQQLRKLLEQHGVD